MKSTGTMGSSGSNKHLSNSMIRTNRGQHHHRNRRHHQQNTTSVTIGGNSTSGGGGAGGGAGSSSVNLTSSSSTLSSMSNCNNDSRDCRELIRNKDKETYDNLQHLQFHIKSGKLLFLSLYKFYVRNF